MNLPFLNNVDFNSTLPMPLLLGLGFIAFAITAYAYYREATTRVSKSFALILALLRLGAISVILIMLAQPTMTLESRDNEPAHVAILLDTSESMNIMDQSNNSSRLSTAQRVMSELNQNLESRFRTKFYSFSSYLEASSLESLRSLKTAAGGATDIGGALRDTLTRESGQTVSAVILLTDGAHNSGSDPDSTAAVYADREIPIFPVGIGSRTNYRDVEVVEAVGPDLIFENEEFTITVRANIYGYNGTVMPFSIRLLKSPEDEKRAPGAGMSPGSPPKVLAEVEMPVTEDAQELRADQLLRFKDAGDYLLEVSLPVQEGELVEHNNRKELALTVRKEKLRILLVEGRPRREYAFLMRSLGADPRLQLLPMVQTRRGKFNIDLPEEWNDFFEKKRPDLVNERQRAFFKAGPGDSGKGGQLLDPPWADFDCIILGDVNSSLFAPGALERLVAAVRDSGRNLVLAGGIDTYNDGNLAQALRPILPCTLAGTAGQGGMKIYMRPSAASTLHPAVQLGAAPGESQPLWDKTPPLIGYGLIKNLQSGAEVLLAKYDSPSGDKETEPLWVVGRTGTGRVLVSAVDDTWRWATELTEGGLGRELFSNLWRRSIRWLVTGDAEGVGRGIKLALDKRSFAVGEEVAVGVKVYGFAESEIKNLSLSMEARGPDGSIEEVRRLESLDKDSQGEARYSLHPSRRGEHIMQALLSLDGVEVARANGSFTVEAGSFEQAQSALNELLLKKLADISSGKYHTQESAKNIPSQIPDKSREVVRRNRVELWDSTFLIICLFLFLGTEWTLRRVGDIA